MGDILVSENLVYHFGDPHNKDYSILGSILGSHFFRKLPWFCGCKGRLED